MAKPTYEESIFINCPFDPTYQRMFDAIVFAVYDCGYVPRSAREEDDFGDVRIEKIYDLIRQSKYSIHDISYTGLYKVKKNRLPRFNMPYELGLVIGCQKFGTKRIKDKKTLVFDLEKYRYPKFLSDIGGQDLKGHNSDPEEVISGVRNWLQKSPADKLIPGPAKLITRYRKFRTVLPKYCAEHHLEVNEVTYLDYCTFVTAWQRDNDF